MPVAEISKIFHISSSDVLLSVAGEEARLWLISLEDGDNFKQIATQGKNEVRHVHSNGGDKVYIYDSQELLTLLNPYTNEIVATSMIVQVKCLSYAAD